MERSAIVQYFKLCRIKIEYLEHKSSNRRQRSQQILTTTAKEVVQKDLLRYQRSIIHKNREIQKEVLYRIRIGWLKWKNISRLL